MDIEQEIRTIMAICEHAFEQGYLDALDAVREFGLEKVDQIKNEVLENAKKEARAEMLRRIKS